MFDSSAGDAGGVSRTDRARHDAVNRCGRNVAGTVNVQRRCTWYAKCVVAKRSKSRIISHAYKECGHVAQCFSLLKFGCAQHDGLIRGARIKTRVTVKWLS